MCYQKVNQNWRKSNPLPSPVQSRFNPLHTVTPWTLQAPANNRPHSTSSQPPPTGTGAAKCISPSRSLHPAHGVQSSYHIFSFEIWSFKHLDLFLKIYYSLKCLATTVLTHICQGWFLPRSSLPSWLFKPLGFLPWNAALSRESWLPDGETRPCSWAGCLFCFHFWTHWQALLSLCGNTKWHIMFIPKVDTGCTKSMVIGLLKSKLWHQKRRNIYFMGVIRSEPLYLMHLSFQ